MAFDNKKYQSNYQTKYVKEHYIRKELRFKPEEWKQIEDALKEKNKTLKDVLFEFANIK